MPTVLKKTKMNSVSDLVAALNKFIFLLEGQKEFDAVEDLKSVVADLEKSPPDSVEFQTAIEEIIEAYDGEHELQAYTLRRQKADDDWTEAEELYLASIEVLNLAKRFSKQEN